MYELEIDCEENIKYIRNLLDVEYFSFFTESKVKSEVVSWLKDSNMNVNVSCNHGFPLENHVINKHYVECRSSQDLLNFQTDDVDRTFMITKFKFDTEEDRNLFKLTWG